MRHLLLLVLPWAGPLEAQTRVVDISNRPDCDRSLYYDLPIGINQAADTAGLISAWRQLDSSLSSIQLSVEYAPTGILLNVTAAHRERSKSDWAVWSAALRPYFHDIPAPGTTLRLQVLRDSTSRQLTLTPLAWTCTPTLTNPGTVVEAFRFRIGELRRRGLIPEGASGRVALSITLDARGKVTSGSVTEPGPLAIVDSVALAALERARFTPGVRGRHSVPSNLVLPLRY